MSADQPIVKSSKKDKKKKKEAGQKFFPLSGVIEGSRKSKKQKKGVKEHFQVEEERPDKIGKSIKKIKKDKSKGKGDTVFFIYDRIWNLHHSNEHSMQNCPGKTFLFIQIGISAKDNL